MTSTTESAQRTQSGLSCLLLPTAHNHQNAIRTHHRSRLTASATALMGMAAQLVDAVLDVPERDLAGTGVEQVQGQQLGGLVCIHGADHKPAMAPISSNTPDPQRRDRARSKTGVMTLRPATALQIPCGTAAAKSPLMSLRNRRPWQLRTAG